MYFAPQSDGWQAQRGGGMDDQTMLLCEMTND
jgi:hypothetical protein